MNVQMFADTGGIALSFRFDPALVEALKRTVPAAGRRWDNGRKLWLIDPAHGGVVADLVYRMTGQRLAVPSPVVAPPTIKLIECLYVGRCRSRDGVGPALASGYADGDWTVTFPEAVLRDWFEGGFGAERTEPTRRPDTLYTTLGVPNTATADELRSGHRRMARQWHPDVCREPDAAERFRAIQAAYEALSDPQKRRRYDAGLALEASLHHNEHLSFRRPGIYVGGDYRSPLRCGFVLVEGAPALGRLVVARILAWQDITNPEGQTLVTSWPTGGTTFERIWV